MAADLKKRLKKVVIFFICPLGTRGYAPISADIKGMLGYHPVQPLYSAKIASIVGH
jgi:hypothetical protein